MRKRAEFDLRFVDAIPSVLSPETMFVSIKYATVVHLCACGCGNEVVTPLSPRDWRLEFDGESVSIFPSIGNWSLTCRSHYWIKKNRVKWAADWPESRVENARKIDRTSREQVNPTNNFKGARQAWEKVSGFFGIRRNK